MEHQIDVREGDASLGELFSRLTADLSKLVRDEVELAKVEINQTVQSAKTAGISMGAAGLLGLMAFVLLSFAAAWGLAEVVPAGVAFLIVGGAYGLVALALLALGRQRLKTAKPVPEQTVETLKEDVAWAKQQMS
jgi:uncharacterized membrane protein YqjE